MHVNLLRHYRPLAQVSHSLTALVLSSQVKYLNFVCLLLANLPRRLHTYLLLQHLLFSPLSPPAIQSEIYHILSNCHNNQSDSECIPPSFLKNVHLQMPLDMEVGLGPGHIVLYGDPAPLPRKGAQPPNFRPMSVVAKRLDRQRCHLAGR